MGPRHVGGHSTITQQRRQKSHRQGLGGIMMVSVAAALAVAGRAAAARCVGRPMGAAAAFVLHSPRQPSFVRPAAVTAPALARYARTQSSRRAAKPKRSPDRDPEPEAAADADADADDEEEEEESLPLAAAAAAAAPPTRVPNAIVPGTVYFVATPLGNLGDMTLRALDVLKGVDLIAAEDTRTTGLLLKALGLEKKPQVSHHQHNAAGRVPDLIRRARDERLAIAVVSDAGTPGISDPGAELAAACWAAGVPLVPVPGACAAVAAVSVAGFAGSTEFVFYGFLPAKSGRARREKVAEVVTQGKPCVLYEAPHRLLRTLGELNEAAVAAAAAEEEGEEGGREREVLCARELTKLHEELFRGTLREAIAHFEAKPPRGEFTLVVGPRVGGGGAGGGKGAFASAEEREEAARGLLRGLMLGGAEGKGVSASEAAKRVAKEVGMSKGEVYKLAMAVKDEGAGGGG